MNIEQLQMFIEVVELGSFSAVAQKRQLNASSVSRSVQTLEESLGVPLLQRSTRKLDLTESGRIYYQNLPSILERLELAKQQALDIKQQLQGTLRVTLPHGFAESVVIPLMPKFRALHPELKFELLITDECLDLSAQKIDVGIRLGRVTESHWVAKSLRSMRFIACASVGFMQKHRIASPSDLAKVPCINFIDQAMARQWAFVKGQDVQTVAVNQTILVTQEQSAKKLCLAGEGVALMPDWLVMEDIANQTLCVLLPEYQARYQANEEKIWCTYPNRDYVPAKTRAFVDFLVAELRV